MIATPADAKVRAPLPVTRRDRTCPEWLDSLDRDRLEKRLQRTRWVAQRGPCPVGFFVHELAYLEKRLTDLGLQAQVYAAQERLRRTEEEAHAFAGVKAGVARLMAETPGDVRRAALRAARIYLVNECRPGLRQAVAVAADQERVSPDDLVSYLAGVGIRALWTDPDLRTLEAGEASA